MTKWLNVSLMLVLSGLTIPARAQQSASRKQNESKSVLSGKGNGDLRRPATEDPDYSIGPQDVLNISVWKEPEVSRTVPVRPDGKISLPLLDDVQAAGLTPMQLASLIAERLRKYLTAPQVTVIVTEINSKRIYILGEVSRAGAYPLFPNMTVLEALSSAGGFTQFANLKKIYVLRDERGRKVKYPVNYKEVVTGNKPEQNILLKAGDTIVVP